MNDSKKIVMLVGGVITSSFMYNGLSERYSIDWVIQEETISRKTILKNRAKKLGYFNVFGQILFGLFLLPIIRYLSKNQYNKIIGELSLNRDSIPLNKLKKVKSINSNQTIKLLKEINPDIVIVNGCRVISSKVLNAIDSIFINTHEGITPKYRGIHGGYWALANNDREHCGVTVHLVDKGIDTGEVLYQALISPSDKDNFCTYHLYQSAKGIELMKKAINDVIKDNITYQKGTAENNIWYHPTLWQYIYFRIFKGVK